VRPFVRITERIESAQALAETDRRFLHDMRADLADPDQGGPGVGRP